MMIALATLMFLSVCALALFVIGHELQVRGAMMAQALGLGMRDSVAPVTRSFRVVQRRRITPVKLAERRPLRAVA